MNHKKELPWSLWVGLYVSCFGFGVQGFVKDLILILPGLVRVSSEVARGLPAGCTRKWRLFVKAQFKKGTLLRKQHGPASLTTLRHVSSCTFVCRSPVAMWVQSRGGRLPRDKNPDLESTRTSFNGTWPRSPAPDPKPEES